MGGGWLAGAEQVLGGAGREARVGGGGCENLKKIGAGTQMEAEGSGQGGAGVTEPKPAGQGQECRGRGIHPVKPLTLQ